MASYKFLTTVFLVIINLIAVKVEGQASAGVPDSSTYATLYLYRPYAYIGAVNNYFVHVGDSISHKMRNDSKYTVHIYKEGTVKVWAINEVKKEILLDVKFGQNYYIKCGVNFGAIKARPRLEIMDPAIGKIDFDNIKKIKKLVD